MWEVRIGSKLISEHVEKDMAEGAARTLRAAGMENVRVIGTGTLSANDEVQIDVLPLSMRKAA